MPFHLHKRSLRRGKSYMKSPEWLKNKRAIISTKNNNGKCFKYAINAELNHQFPITPKRMEKF